MSEVTYLSEFRDRRAFRETDLQPFLDVIDRDVAELARLADPWLPVDEVHHWTQNNTAFEQLRRAYLNHWSDASPERREEVARALRILRSTDQGSDGGDAEGHQGDDRPA